MNKFEAGFPGEGVESMFAGRVRYGEKFEDVRMQIEELDEAEREAVVLLVACDRIYGFFENRGGVENGPLLIKLVRDYANELSLTTSVKAEVSQKEAKEIYDEVVAMGAMECVNELGAKNVFCTVWKMISEIVSLPETK